MITEYGFEIELNGETFDIELHITNKYDDDFEVAYYISLFKNAEKSIKWFIRINKCLPIKNINFVILDNEETKFFKVDKQGSIYSFYDDKVAIWLEEL
jgi:hypothetical protein